MQHSAWPPRSLTALVLGAILAALLGVATTTATAPPASAMETQLVNAPGTTSGWFIQNGNRQWLNAACRNQLQDSGHAFTTTAWNNFGSLPTATVQITCDEIQQILQLGNPGSGAASFVTNSAGNSAGWVLLDGTKQWINTSCRNQLTNAGANFTLTTYSQIGNLPDLTPPRSCNDLVGLIGDNGGGGGTSAQLVTNSAGNPDGWVIVNGAKQWIASSCRGQLQSGGVSLNTLTYNQISALPTTSTVRNCTQLLTVFGVTNGNSGGDDGGGDGDGGDGDGGDGGGGDGGGNGVPSLTVTQIAAGLTHVWDMEFTPDGALLYTQRGGVLGVRLPNGVYRNLQANLSDVLVERLTGLMGLAVDPNFANNRRFYTCQTNVQKQGEIIAWTVNANYTVATRVADPLVGNLEHSSTVHVGCRITVGPDGFLWITGGDNNTVFSPQSLSSTAGKVLRVDRFSGLGAPGNPYASSSNPKTRMIYTFGHRNPQGIAFQPGTNTPYLIEHGPDEDDEINRLVSGGNYGWQPGPGYDQNQPMTNFGLFPNARAASWKSGRPTVAPAGGDFIQGSNWGALNGTLAVAMLKETGIWFYAFDNAGVYGGMYVAPELDGTVGRIRHAEMGPDGSLYISTTNGGGNDKIYRVTPNT